MSERPGWRSLSDGIKTPVWKPGSILVPCRLLQEIRLALSADRGLTQRLRSHAPLDARDERALGWADAVLHNLDITEHGEAT